MEILAQINPNTWWILAGGIIVLAYSALVLFTAYFLIRENRDPEVTLTWILVLIFFPLIGIVIFLSFGKSFRKVKMFSRKGLLDLERMEHLSQNQIRDLSKLTLQENGLIKSKSNIIKLLLNNSKSLLTQHNSLEVLINGTNTFDSILEAIRMAKHHIHLEYYIYEDDEIGNKIKALLMEKARHGVEVRLILDAIGCWGLSKRFLKDFTDDGVELHEFMPVRIPRLANKINYRNHRKIIVVDGQIGFVGGLNIADRYINGDPKLGIWRDTHLKIVGDAVQSLQALFITDWYFVSEKNIHGDQYFPKHSIEEKQLVQITGSGPDSDWASIMQAYFTAITTARHSIYISTPYFMPNQSILTAIKTAALSGVDVKIILPGKSDLATHLWASRSYVEELLRAGANVYFYQKGFSHAKVMMVDGIFSTIGTANMDSRSFDKNFEVNALIYDQQVAKVMEENFRQDIKDSEKIELESYLKRPRRNKVKESLARVLSPIF
ncbi:MAG: cardiolipin synthase [Cyclobacteriaceae bacterium]